MNRPSRLCTLLVALSFALQSVAAGQCELQSIVAPGTQQSGVSVAVDGDRFAIGAATGEVRIYRQVGRTAFLEQTLLGPPASFGHELALDGDFLAVTAPCCFGPTEGAVHLFERHPDGVWEEAERISWLHERGFLSAVALDGDRLAIGAEADGRGYPGEVFLYERDGGGWQRTATLRASADRSTNFGMTLKLEGERLVVSGHVYPGNTPDGHGTIQVLEETAAGWQTTAVLTAPDPATDSFGSSIDLSGDVLLAGARGNAWVFEHVASGWTAGPALAPPGLEPRASFGQAVALGKEGTSAWIGAPRDDEAASNGGAVRVFDKRDGSWHQEALLLPKGPSRLRGFGGALAIDGDLALVASPSSNERRPSDVSTYSVGEVRCRTLHAQPAQISLSQGGRQTLRLNPGREHTGRLYVLGGSTLGTDPGFLLGGARIPLIPDDYLACALQGGGCSPFVGNIGVLGGSPPQAEVTIEIPSGSDPAFAGLTLYHAFVVFEQGVVHVSNVRTLELLP